MNILITGGTGLIGRALCTALLAENHTLTVLTRRPHKVPSQCQAIQSLSEWQPQTNYDAVINLAGEPIVDKPWTPERKKILWDSRVTLTQDLVKHMAAAEQMPKVFLSGSAIGYYGNSDDTPLDESSPHGADFSAQLCLEWEKAALEAPTRVCLLRTGLVLDRTGGFLSKMLLPFKLGLGGYIGSGKQWMSWIHMTDYIAIVLLLLNNPDAKGAYNMTAPTPVTNLEFTSILAKTLKRPAVFWTPNRVLQCLLGERASLLIEGQRVLPAKVNALGYPFVYPDLARACQALLSA